MAGVADAIVSPIEDLFDSMGMMQGESAPLKRTIFGLGLGAAFVFLLKPDLCFAPDGSLRPWSLTATAEEKNSTTNPPTPVPWWMLTAAPAVLFGVFI